MRQRVLLGVAAVALTAALFALSFYRMPVVALTPGPVEDVLGRIRVEGGARVYDSKGKLYLTSVGIDDNVRFYEALLDLANRDVQVRPRHELFPDNETPEEIDTQSAIDMNESKTTATVVALRHLGYRVDPSAVRVAQVLRNAPAAGRLAAGDTILAVDRHKVSSVENVQAAIGRHKVGDRVVFAVRRDGADRDVAVMVGADQGKPRVGVVLSNAFERLPVRIRIDTEDIGGPSAGLMFTLSIIDKLTPEDLTGGRRIAGTGEINLAGQVLPIGGVAEKLVAARRRGATVFLLPKANCPEVRGHAPAGLRLVQVASIDDALRYLHQPPATTPGC